MKNNAKNLRLNTDRTNKVSFEMTLTGLQKESVGQKPKIRFSIVESDSGITHSFPVKSYNGKEINIEIPPLPYIKPQKKHTALIEVVIGDQIFSPYSSDITFLKKRKAAPALRTEKKMHEVKKYFKRMLREALEVHKGL